MPVAIAGQYRNGTSLVAKVLYHILGYYAGEPDELSLHNVEHKLIRQHSNKFLRANDGDWIRIRKLQAFNEAHPVGCEWAHFDGWHNKAERLLDSLRQPASKMNVEWFWKDTRLPVLLDAWYPHMHDTKIIVPYRHPEQAVTSMLALADKPYGFDAIETKEQGYAVWEMYYQRLLQWIALHPDAQVIGLDYAEWFTGFARTHRKLEKFLAHDVNYVQLARLFAPTKNINNFYNLPPNHTYMQLQCRLL